MHHLLIVLHCMLAYAVCNVRKQSFDVDLTISGCKKNEALNRPQNLDISVQAVPYFAALENIV